MRKTKWNTVAIRDLAFITGIMVAWIVLVVCWGGFPR